MGYYMLTHIEALELVKPTSKFVHVMIVSDLMKKLAQQLSQNHVEWELVGLLHDLDYDEVQNNMAIHGRLAADKLCDQLPPHCLHAILVHDSRLGFKATSWLDKALRAIDSFTIIMEESGTGPNELTPELFKITLDHISGKQPWHKQNLSLIEDLGMSFDAFLNFCIDSLKLRK